MNNQLDIYCRYNAFGLQVRPDNISYGAGKWCLKLLIYSSFARWHLSLRSSREVKEVPMLTSAMLRHISR
jgi:hypothetical protein